MRMLNMRSLSLALALGALALPASGGTLYQWTAEDGSVSYTDDAKRVPERYRAAAKQITVGGLTGYARHTPTRPEVQAEYVDQLAERIERLRTLNRDLDEEAAARAAVAAAGPVPGARGIGPSLIRVGRNLSVAVPDTAEGEAPVVVDDVRVRQPGSVFTVHDTVISQGGRVLMVVRGDKHNFEISADVLEEDELLSEDELIQR
jgi:hypothetical protein